MAAGTDPNGNVLHHQLPFDDVLQAKTEMRIESKKEIKLPLVINQIEITSPLIYVDRCAIIEEMKSMVRKEQEKIKPESNVIKQRHKETWKIR